MNECIYVLMICCRCMLDVHFAGIDRFSYLRVLWFQVWILCGFMQECMTEYCGLWKPVQECTSEFYGISNQDMPGGCTSWSHGLKEEASRLLNTLKEKWFFRALTGTPRIQSTGPSRKPHLQNVHQAWVFTSSGPLDMTFGQAKRQFSHFATQRCKRVESFDSSNPKTWNRSLRRDRRLWASLDPMVLVVLGFQ